IESCELRTLLSLNLSLSVNDTLPNVGDIITFTVTVSNTGSSINGVQVNDLLPSGLTFSTSSASQGSYSGTTGLWSVGTLGSNASASLSIKAFAAFPGDKTNTATATGGGFSSSKSIVVTPQQVNVAVGTSVNGHSGV